MGSVLKRSRAPRRDRLGNLTKHHPSQDATLAEVARSHKWRHLVTQVFLLAQSWSAAGCPRSPGHALSLARVMVMVEGGTRVDGFFLPHKAFTPFRLLEPSTQVTPCDITSCRRKVLPGKGEHGFPLLGIHPAMYLLIYSPSRSLTHPLVHAFVFLRFLFTFLFTAPGLGIVPYTG